MAAGLVASIIAFAAGAILKFAVTVSPYQHGFNVNTVGVILMIVGVVGALLSIIGLLVGPGGIRQHRTTIDDGTGNIVRRDDVYR